MITIELMFFVAVIALIISITSLLAYGYALKSHKNRIIELQSRLHCIEAGIYHHEMAPLPWEIEDLEVKTFKQEGNVVYLQKEE